MSLLIDSWDSGQPGAFWDVGLQWDVNIGPNPGNPTRYLNLITSEHNKSPKYMETLELLMQPLADIQAVMAMMVSAFDIDTAAGVQLDAIGVRVGQSRDLVTQLTDVYFSLDSATLGLDQGSMQGPFDPNTGLLQLPDDDYRALLRAVILQNQWDGTIPGAYTVLNAMFPDSEPVVFDEGDAHMALGLLIVPEGAVIAALFSGGYVQVKPGGVKMDGFYTPVAPGVPFFGLDAENSAISGLDVGAFAS